MKRWQLLGMLLSFPLLLLGLVWQTGRQAALRAEAQDLEQRQESWVEANAKLIGGIAVLENRERAATLAEKLGLERATAARRIFIEVGSSDTSDAGAAMTPQAGKGNG